jgi:eukaryotic-like serine/threonine-protein kinase
MDESQPETRASIGPTQALDRWGPFEQLERVGQGSFGEVYRAFDPSLQRFVALKLLLPGAVDRDEEAAAALREARAIARLRHPNILPIHGVDRHQGRVGFWTDFVRGQTLATFLDTHGPMGPREAVHIGIEVCQAVSAVHAAGLVHGDIKTGNIMREEGGRLLLMDFGLSQAHGASDVAAGTPLYMAPELFEGKSATTATDVYAIGVVLFNLLTKAYPCVGRGVQELRLAHASRQRRSLLDLRPDVPHAVAGAIEQALQPDPSDRPPTAGQFAGTLSQALGGPVDRSSRPRARLVALAAVAVAVVAALFIWRVVALRPAIGENAAARAEYQEAHAWLQSYYKPAALEKTIPVLERIVARDPAFAPAYADLARANYLQFVQQRDEKYIEPARNAAQRAIDLAPATASPHVTLGALYARLSQHDLAAHELSEAVRLDRFDASAYAAFADLYGRQGRTEEVEANLQKALSLAPDDWAIIQQLGEFYLNNGRWQDAEKQYRRAAELVPDNPRAHNNLGLVYRGLDRLDESAAAFRKSIELEPTFLRYRNLGMVLAEAGDYADAVPALMRAIEMRPQQYRAWGLLGFVYLNQGLDSAKVRAAFEKAIQLAAPLLQQTPRDEYLLADIGSYHAALGNVTESLSRLRQAEALAANVPEVLIQVAIGYRMLNRDEDASRALSNAIARGYPSAAVARTPQLATVPR